MKEKVGGWGKLFPVSDSERLLRLIFCLAAEPSAQRDSAARITQPVMIAGLMKLWQARLCALTAQM